MMTCSQLVLVVGTLAAADIRTPGGPYCGIECVYAGARLLDRQVMFHDLLRPSYLGSRTGSSLDELRQACRDSSLAAIPIERSNMLVLRECPYPVVLHVRGSHAARTYNHYVLFLGVKGDRARVFDPPNPVESLTFAELGSLWDGNGLIISDTPINLGSIIAPARRRVLLCASAAVVAVFALRLARRFTPADLFKSPRAILGLSLAQAMGLTVLTLLCALLCHFFSDEGLLANASATTAIQQAHAGDFIPRIGESGVWSRIGNGTVLVDARFPRDYKAGHMDGAINIPIDANEAVLRQIAAKVDKASQVVVYCQSKGCPFAEKVAVRLIGDGFTDVSIYRGGWTDWISKNGKPKEGKS